jgi:hypothetical protein
MGMKASVSFTASEMTQSGPMKFQSDGLVYFGLIRTEGAPLAPTA